LRMVCGPFSATRAFATRETWCKLFPHSAVSVAQLVEHRSVAPRVAGSNPVAHPNSLNVYNVFVTGVFSGCTKLYQSNAPTHVPVIPQLQLRAFHAQRVCKECCYGGTHSFVNFRESRIEVTPHGWTFFVAGALRFDLAPDAGPICQLPN
jgi:hypothetical protein